MPWIPTRTCISFKHLLSSRRLPVLRLKCRLKIDKSYSSQGISWCPTLNEDLVLLQFLYYSVYRLRVQSQVSINPRTNMSFSGLTRQYRARGKRTG